MFAFDLMRVDFNNLRRIPSLYQTFANSSKKKRRLMMVVNRY